MADKPKRGPSEEFYDAFSYGGSLVSHCICGIVHFCSRGDYEKGEYERLCKSAEEKPNLYHEHYDCDSISFASIDGKEFVYKCSCNELARYESFVWHHRRGIARYLKAMAGHNKLVALDDCEVADEAAGAIQKMTKLEDLVDKVKNKLEGTNGTRT